MKGLPHFFPKRFMSHETMRDSTEVAPTFDHERFFQCTKTAGVKTDKTGGLAGNENVVAIESNGMAELVQSSRFHLELAEAQSKKKAGKSARLTFVLEGAEMSADDQKALDEVTALLKKDGIVMRVYGVASKNGEAAKQDLNRTRGVEVATQSETYAALTREKEAARTRRREEVMQPTEQAA